MWLEEKKTKKKQSEHERMRVFGILSTRGRYYTHAPHTEHEGEYLFGSDIHTCQAECTLACQYCKHNELKLLKYKRYKR